jgi:hypothetical protein
MTVFFSLLLAFEKFSPSTTKVSFIFKNEITCLNTDPLRTKLVFLFQPVPGLVLSPQHLVKYLVRSRHLVIPP